MSKQKEKTTEGIHKKSLSDYVEIPRDFEILSKPKAEISRVLVESMKEQNLTVRGLAESIFMKHPQVINVIRGNNYRIDTLLQILDGLGLELTIQKRK